MSLPPGFLEELRNRTSIAQVVGRKVMWDSRKSNPGKGDMWAPCPFHQEKTASFHVEDAKGFYYCFGCHAKGDALGFIKETENVSFMEAVEILAREAGMPMPARDPQAEKKRSERAVMVDVMEQAVRQFRMNLQTSAGAAARGYLNKRGLTQETLDQFEIGFAQDSWQGLYDHLTAKDIPAELLQKTGLSKSSNKGGKDYDTFRNRIMFPIRDPRGQAIGFGGRAMDPNDNAKYLNSPETPLFDKGRTLFNLGPARQKAGKGEVLIVAEGYMDVIALAQAGFGCAVAPLGTAITEPQLEMMWRVSDEPIIALDGDTAGLRAAQRVIDLALPLLQAGKSLRFAMMPTGQDPDDVIQKGGPDAMQALLDNAQPMVRLLWQRETADKVFDSPERKAALDKTLREKLKTIRDPSIRRHYGDEIQNLRRALFRPAQSKNFGKWQPNKAQGATASAKQSSLNQGAIAEGREAVILAAILKQPACLLEVSETLSTIEFSNRFHDQMRGFFASYLGTPEDLWDATEAGFGTDALLGLFKRPDVRIAPILHRAKDYDFVSTAVAAELKLIVAPMAHALEVEDAERDIHETTDEGLTFRVTQSGQSVNDAKAGPGEETDDFETAKNGAKIKRKEQLELDALLSNINFSKPEKR